MIMRKEKYGFEDDFNILNPIPDDSIQIANLNPINDKFSINQKRGEKKNSHRRSFSQ